ncbi:MAG TPA: hypothetical protein VGJ83_05575 [Gemmatimonadales bacterium]
MSRLAFPLALALGAVPSLGAQDANLTHLRWRADSLLGEWRQANAIADLVDSLERERAGSGRDTIAVGALRIVTNPSPLRVREAAARAWPLLDSLYGSAAAGLATRPYLVRAFDPDTTVRRPGLHVGMEVPWTLDVSALTQVLLANVPLDQPDPALSAWLSAPVRLLGSARTRGAVYVQLVTAPFQPARSCFLGDLRACRDALELGDGDPIERWYPGPTERRAVVSRWLPGASERPASAPGYRACVAGDDAACTNLLRSVPAAALPRPLDVTARATLVQTARRLGGREAYARLMAHPDAPMAERLASSAGVDLDVLLSKWRSEILAARPAPVALPPWALWVASAWTVVFAACGLRSSRWRVT